MPQGSGGKDDVIWSCLGERIRDAISSRGLDEARRDFKDDSSLLLARKIIMLDSSTHTLTVCDHFVLIKMKVINHFFQSLFGLSTVSQCVVLLVQIFLKQLVAEWGPYASRAAFLCCGGIPALAMSGDKR